LGSNVGETTSRSEERSSVGNSNFTSCQRAGSGRANWGGSSGSLGDGIEFGGTNRDEVRGSCGVVGSQLVGRAIFIGSSVGSGVAGSSQDGHTSQTNLLEFSVNSLNVLHGVDTKVVASWLDLALIFLGPAPRHGDDVRNLCVLEKGKAEVVQPVSLSPVPVLGLLTDGCDVLVIKGGFDSDTAEGTNDFW